MPKKKKPDVVEATPMIPDVQQATPDSPKVQALKEAQQRKQDLIRQLAQAKDKYESLQVQINHFIEVASVEGPSEEAQALAYDVMYRRYLTKEFK